MDDSIYTLKRYKKKKKKRSYKLLYLIIIVLSLLICFKKDNTLKDKFKQNFNCFKFFLFKEFKQNTIDYGI